MLPHNKKLYIFLILIWSGFILWEYSIQNTSNVQSEYMIRFDLIILPILLLFTGYAIFQIARKQKAENQ
tara:strand:+ start:571 stop:777 length:207 start_codon:yes stop_codon:yes gene_type:complete